MFDKQINTLMTASVRGVLFCTCFYTNFFPFPASNFLNSAVIVHGLDGKVCIAIMSVKYSSCYIYCAFCLVLRFSLTTQCNIFIHDRCTVFWTNFFTHATQMKVYCSG
mgnify:CR=1 FL=1